MNDFTHGRDQDSADTATQANRTYYQSAYDQIHASGPYKERLIHMYTEKNVTLKTRATRTRRFYRKAAAAAAALAITLPTGVYAARHYPGIADFFSQYWQPLSDDATRLIETDIVQSPSEADSETRTPSSDTPARTLPVSFTVREALCDSGSVNIIVEAKATESGKYLLVPDTCLTAEDSVESIGIHEDLSFEQYARNNHLELLFVNTGFHPDSPFSPASCMISAESRQHDVLDIFISADREKTDTDLDVLLTHSIRTSGNNTDILKSSTSFTLKDQSTSHTTVYLPQEDGRIPGTDAVIHKVLIEQTELSAYVTVCYRPPHISGEDSDLHFDLADSSGNKWPCLRNGSTIQLEDGSCCLHLSYNQSQIPESFLLQVFSYSDHHMYGQIRMVRD